MNKITLTIFIIFQALYCFGQSKPYIVQYGNSYIRKGITKQNNEIDNYQRVKIVTKDTTYFLFPKEISEYRNNVGEYYKTFKILSQNEEIEYFLKFYSKSNFGELYSCIDPKGDERIFLLRDDLIDLKEKQGSQNYYASELMKLNSTCDNVEQIIKDTRFSTASINRALISLETCRVRFAPKKSLHFNFSVAGLSLRPNLNASIIPIAQLGSDELYSGSRSILIEVAYSIPIDKSILAFHPAISFNSYSTSLTYVSDFIAYDFEYDLSTIEVSPSFKLSLPSSQIKPTIYAGPTFAIPVIKDVELRRATTDPTTLLVENEVQSARRITGQIGYYVRIGLETKLTNKLGVGVNFGLKQFKQLGGTNPKFDVFIPHFGVLLFWE